MQKLKNEWFSTNNKYTEYKYHLYHRALRVATLRLYKHVNFNEWLFSCSLVGMKGMVCCESIKDSKKQAFEYLLRGISFKEGELRMAKLEAEQRLKEISGEKM